MEPYLPPPLHPADFCQKWVPLVKGITPEKYGYRKIASQFLAEITGYSEGTCSTLLSRPMDELPGSLPARLGALDSLWEARSQSLRPLDLLHPKDFCEKWIPRLQEKQPKQHGYRKAAYHFLSEITGYKTSSCDKYLSASLNEVPRILPAYLAVLDRLWDAQASPDEVKKMFLRVDRGEN